MTGRMIIDSIELRPEPCRMCHNRQLCKERELACDEFVSYVGKSYSNRGRPFTRTPTKALYYEVFPNLDPDRTETV